MELVDTSERRVGERVLEASAGPSLAAVARRGRNLLASPAVQDGLAAGALTAAAIGGLLAHVDVNFLDGDVEVFRRLDAVGVALVLLQTVPIAFRRRAPVLTLAVTAAALLAFSLLHYPPSLGSFGFMVSTYTVAANRDRTVSVPAALVAAVVMIVVLAAGRQSVAPDTLIADYLILGAAWFFGEGLRLRRRYVVALENRAARLEVEREERARAAVAQERRVIARELHDVVAHNVSVMVAQAGAARRVVEREPRQGVDALGTIERTGREALVEMRRLTGLLRTDADGEDARAPQPGLENLPALIEQVGRSGIPVTLRTVGHPLPLAAGLDLSAYRIVQESLTNALKHARPAPAEVVVRYTPTCLELTVTTTGGAWPAPHRPGFGLLGMRERVALFGGELRTGPRNGPGWRVHASLPLDGGAA
jgi:signal transduction histidine kinase